MLNFHPCVSNVMININIGEISFIGFKLEINLLVVSIPYLVIGSALCVFGTLGNLCVLGAVAVHRALQNSRSVFLVNLAIADLIVTSIADPFAVVGKFFLDHKYRNNLIVES